MEVIFYYHIQKNLNIPNLKLFLFKRFHYNFTKLLKLSKQFKLSRQLWLLINLDIQNHNLLCKNILNKELIVLIIFEFFICIDVSISKYGLERCCKDVKKDILPGFF